MTKATTNIPHSVTEISGSVTGDKNLSSTGDARVRALFREWREASRSSDLDQNLDRCFEIEAEIMSTPGGGAALAIKAYLFFLNFHLLPDGAPQDALLRYSALFDKDAAPSELGEEEEGLMVSMLRDAARQVPELAELVAPIAHEDAALIDADIEVQSEPDPQRLTTLIDRIAKTEAKTPRGEEIKSRHAA